MGVACCSGNQNDYLTIIDKEETKKEIIDTEWPNLSEKIKKMLTDLSEFKWEEPNVDLKKYQIFQLKNSTYQGEWEGDQRHGKCQEIDSNGNYQLGQFQNNKRNGNGRLISQNGDGFEGPFKDGIPWGKGKFWRSDGMKFEGNFEGFGQKFLNGIGKQETPDNTIQEGEFLQGQEHGQGKVKLIDGSCFEGIFENKEMKYGTMEWLDKTKQTGYFEKKKFHGKGKMEQPSGKIFEGNYINGVKNGLGTLTNPDGSTITGNYVKGNLDGTATLKIGEQEQDVVYQNGKKVSKKRRKLKKNGFGTPMAQSISPDDITPMNMNNSKEMELEKPNIFNSSKMLPEIKEDIVSNK